MNRMAELNLKPEQIAREAIDKLLARAEWREQSKNQIDFSAGPGIAIREYQTDVGPADYVLFVDKNPVGVIEAKLEQWGHKITVVEDQSSGYAAANLKWVNNKEPLTFVYESTGVLTRFTDTRDPKPRSREVMSRPLICARGGDDLDSGLTRMRKHHIRRLPVLNDDGELIGVVTLDDILLQMSKSLNEAAALVREEVAGIPQESWHPVRP